MVFTFKQSKETKFEVFTTQYIIRSLASSYHAEVFRQLYDQIILKIIFLITFLLECHLFQPSSGIQVSILYSYKMNFGHSLILPIIICFNGLSN